MIRIDGREHTADGKGSEPGECRNGNAKGSTSTETEISSLGSLEMLAGRIREQIRDTVVRLCKVYVLENVGGSGGRLGAEVSDLRDVGRRGRRLEGKLEGLVVGKGDWRRGFPGNWGTAISSQ